MTVYEPPENAARSITVRALLDDPALELNVRLVGGAAGLDRVIAHPRIQKSGLVLVGHTHGLVPERVQILGETELSYIEALTPERLRTMIDAYYEGRGLDGDGLPDAHRLEALGLHVLAT